MAYTDDVLIEALRAAIRPEREQTDHALLIMHGNAAPFVVRSWMHDLVRGYVAPHRNLEAWSNPTDWTAATIRIDDELCELWNHGEPTFPSPINQQSH